MVGFYDTAIPFQLSLLDTGFELLQSACFLLFHGVSDSIISDTVCVGEALLGSAAFHFCGEHVSPDVKDDPNLSTLVPSTN